jgi:hypothetical protein
MIYTYALRPKYVLFGPDGKIEEIFCKVCGSAIAGMRSRIIGTRFDSVTNKWIETEVRQFSLLPNYTEIKMQFKDGSYHVANGCRSCLSAPLTPEQLHELHIADMELDDMIYPGKADHMARVPVGVVAIRYDGGGIP